MGKDEAARNYSRQDLMKIRKRASEIWKGKCQSLNTALDDWLEAEREFWASTETRIKKFNQYTGEEVSAIRERAQAIRDEKVKSLRTAFDDWIEAEQEFKAELNKKVDVHGLFDRWFNKSSSRVTELLDEETPIKASIFKDVFEQQYIELMAECMK